MVKGVEGSLELAKLQLKWGITAVNCLKARRQDNAAVQLQSDRPFQQQLNEVCCPQLQITALPH